jgi:hypothetical protein
MEKYAAVLTARLPLVFYESAGGRGTIYSLPPRILSQNQKPGSFVFDGTQFISMIDLELREHVM